MKNDCRLPRNFAVLVAVVVCAMFFVSCDNIDWPTFVVTFDANGGTGTVPSRSGYPHSYITLPDGSGFSRDGFVFEGWGRFPDSSPGSQMVQNAGDTVSLRWGHVTLYAVWQWQYSIVSFNANGGSGQVPSPQTVVRWNTRFPGAGGLWREGYVFAGWNTCPLGTGASFRAENSYWWQDSNMVYAFTTSGNVVLYAMWQSSFPQGKTLAERLSYLRTNAHSGGSYIIELSSDETISPAGAALPTNRNNLTITLRGIGAMRTVSLSENGVLFSISSGVTLVLDNNVTLVGRNQAAHDTDTTIILYGWATAEPWL